MEPLLVTIDDAARSTHLSRVTVYKLIAAGELEAVKIGKSRRITVASLEAFVDRLRDASTGNDAA